jgi:hypothetical protein
VALTALAPITPWTPPVRGLCHGTHHKLLVKIHIMRNVIMHYCTILVRRGNSTELDSAIAARIPGKSPAEKASSNDHPLPP